MKCRIIHMTPSTAKSLLGKNLGNRQISEKKLKEYVTAMNNGEWKANGESIIIGSNGLMGISAVLQRKKE